MYPQIYEVYKVYDERIKTANTIENEPKKFIDLFVQIIIFGYMYEHTSSKVV